MHTIAVVVPDGALTFELAVPCEVFGNDRSYLGVPWYGFRTCGARPGPVRLSGGFTLDVEYGPEGLAGADTVIVSPGADLDDVTPPGLLQAIRDAHARGARIASICAGAFILAEAGLLDGRRATTHWMYADELARRYPKTKVDPGVLFVDDGDVLTSAGTAAGLDLCLHLIARDHGAHVAAGVGRRLVVPPHRDGGQAQFIEQPAAPSGTDLAPVLDDVMRHLDAPHTVRTLATAAGMSPRTFLRHFHEEVGTSPIQWLTAQRVRAARERLERGDEPVDAVARRCGFAGAAGLRKHFTRMVGVPPHTYRRTFRG